MIALSGRSRHDHALLYYVVVSQTQRPGYQQYAASNGRTYWVLGQDAKRAIADMEEFAEFEWRWVCQNILGFNNAKVVYPGMLELAWETVAHTTGYHSGLRWSGPYLQSPANRYLKVRVVPWEAYEYRRLAR